MGSSTVEQLSVKHLFRHSIVFMDWSACVTMNERFDVDNISILKRECLVFGISSDYQDTKLKSVDGISPEQVHISQLI